MSITGKSTAFFTLCLLVTAMSLSAPAAAKMSAVQHQTAKTQLQALMGEDNKDYKKRYSIDRNGMISVVNYEGRRLRGSANNLFVAFNSNNLFMANMVYYGFVWRNNFNIFSRHMVFARQFRSTQAARNWARLMIKETAKLAAMTGHGDDPLATQKIGYLENEIRNFEAGDSRNRTVRQWYKQVVIPALREAGSSSSQGSESLSGRSVANTPGEKMRKVKCFVYCNPRHGKIRFNLEAPSREAAERYLKGKSLSKICRANGYRSVGGGIASDGIGCMWN